jgi:hypothetical protein
VQARHKQWAALGAATQQYGARGCIGKQYGICVAIAGQHVTFACASEIRMMLWIKRALMVMPPLCVESRRNSA